MNVQQIIDNLPQIPADCFGLAIPTKVKGTKGTMVESEKVLWFKENKPAKTVEEVIATNEDIDTCWIDDAGEPGSEERIKALAAHYAMGDEVAPFVSTDTEIADELMYRFAENSLINNLTSGKELTEVIRSLAQNCY
jgi:hypothetical protein